MTCWLRRGSTRPLNVIAMICEKRLNAKICHTFHCQTSTVCYKAALKIWLQTKLDTNLACHNKPLFEVSKTMQVWLIGNSSYCSGKSQAMGTQCL